jgi:hypothetical protein
LNATYSSKLEELTLKWELVDTGNLPIIFLEINWNKLHSNGSNETGSIGLVKISLILKF